jgi:ATP-dependent DNA ligase
VKGSVAGLVALRAKVNDTRQMVTATKQMAVAALRITPRRRPTRDTSEMVTAPRVGVRPHVSLAVRPEVSDGLAAARTCKYGPARVLLAQRLSEAGEILARLGGQCMAEYKYDGHAAAGASLR